MDTLTGFDFVDCLLVDFSIDKTASVIELIIQAYYPINKGESIRKKGRIKLTASGISELKMKINGEFKDDVLRHYDANGNDYKANEVYKITIDALQNDKKDVEVESDFLEMQLACNSIEIVMMD